MSVFLPVGDNQPGFERLNVLLNSLALTVKDPLFGARADGVTDDTVAISAARDAAGVGGTVVFPPGTYMVHGIFMTKAFQTWVLQPGAVIKSTAVNAQGVTIAVSAAGCRIVGGGVVDGNGANVTSDVAGIFGVNSTCTDLTVEGVTIQNCKGSAFNACASRSKLRFSKVTNSPTTSVASIPAVQIAPAGSDIVGCEIVGNEVDLTALNAGVIAGPGVFMGGAPRTGGSANYNFNVRGSRVSGNHVSLPSSPTSPGAICVSFGCLNSTCVDNNTSGGSMGVSADSSDDCIVGLNEIFAPNFYGIECASCERTIFALNKIDGNGITGGGASGSAGLSGIETTGAYDSQSCVFALNSISNLVAGSNAVAANKGKYHLVALNSGSGITGGVVSGDTDILIALNMLVGTGAVGSRAIRFTNTVGRAAVLGNLVSGWDKGVEFSPSSVAQDNIAVLSNIFGVGVTTPIFDGKTGTGTLGNSLKLAGNEGADDYLDWKGKVGSFSGTGSPEGVVTAGVGSTFRRTNGGAATSFYVKESGTGNTGWVAK